MKEGQNKQIVINPDLHRRLKIHVAELGVHSIKDYVESIIEHAIITSGTREVQEQVVQEQPEQIVEEVAEVIEPMDEPNEPEAATIITSRASVTEDW